MESITSGLEALPYADLRKLATDTKTALDAREAAEKHSMRLRMRAEAEAAGFTIADLFAEELRSPPAEAKKRGSNSRPAKYRSPTGELWAGIGKRPKWLSQAIAAGASIEDFLIQQPT